MSSSTGVMHIAPQEMRGTAADLGRLSGDAEQARQQLRHSWKRLDGGWEWYAAEDINGHYGRAMDAMDRMSAVLREMDEALVKTADLIEAADLAAAAFFELNAAEGQAGKLPGLARPVPPPPPPPPNPDFDATGALAGVSYAPVDGELFVGGANGEPAIHPSDVTQGYLGDCYFLSSLAALATTPRGRDWLANHIVKDGDTYAVTFYERKALGEFEPVRVRVSSEFPMVPGSPNNDDMPVFAKFGDRGVDGRLEVWVMAYEKAYAQYFGGYKKIEGGWGGAAMEAITGVSSEAYVYTGADLPFSIDGQEMVVPGMPNKMIPADINLGGPTFDQLADHVDRGDAVTVGSLPLPEVDTRRDKIEVDIPVVGHQEIPMPDPATWISPVYNNQDVHTQHEYYVIGVDRATREVVLRNPHSYQEIPIRVTYDQFQIAFPFVSINPIPSVP